MSRRVGVLFVHGIGLQRPGATLASFGDPLLAWIERWSSHRDGHLSVVTSALAEGAPRHVVADWSLDGDEAIRVVLAESWWAEAFATPSLSQVLKWAPGIGYRALGRMGVWYVLLGAAVYAVLGGLFIGKWAVDEWLIALSAFALLLLLPYLLVVLLIPLSLLPFTRPIMRAVATWLIQAAGDAYALVNSPTRFAAMRGIVARDLTWLGEEVDEVIVVAHSQGSVVALETLAARSDFRIHTFLTLGSAIRLLVTQQSDPVARFQDAHPETAWINLYNKLDPVSAGPIGVSGSYPVDIALVHEGTPWAAHTGYPADIEGLQMLLLSRVAEAGGRELWSPESSLAVREALEAGRRRVQAAFVAWAYVLMVATAVAAVMWKSGIAQDTTGWLLDKGLAPGGVPLLADEMWAASVAAALCGVAAGVMLVLHAVLFSGPARSVWRRRWTTHLVRNRGAYRWDPAGLVSAAAVAPVTAGLLVLTHHHDRDNFTYTLAMTSLGVASVAILAGLLPWRDLPERDRRLHNARSRNRYDAIAALSLPDTCPLELESLFGRLFPAYQDRIRGVEKLSYELLKNDQATMLEHVAEALVESTLGLRAVQPGVVADEDGRILEVRAFHQHHAVEPAFAFGLNDKGSSLVCIAVCHASEGCRLGDPATWHVLLNLVRSDLLYPPGFTLGTATTTWVQMRANATAVDVPLVDSVRVGEAIARGFHPA